MPFDIAEFRTHLLRWYDGAKRSLPWRANTDPWRVLVSEFMLQQTRVEAVIPFYERFLQQFPSPKAFAAASEEQVLAAWSGLGYYSRARNLQRAAVDLIKGFPTTLEGVRALPGIGPYTAAAVSSIVLGLPYAAVDGNVLRVVARLTADSEDISFSATQIRIRQVSQSLLDPERPGDFNQAVMELGATVCLPRNPMCLVCPVAAYCKARKMGRQNELPIKRSKMRPQAEILQLAIVEHGRRLLLRHRPSSERRMAKFWELPELGWIEEGSSSQPLLSFRHTIVQTLYTVEVYRSEGTPRPGMEMRWFGSEELETVPLTTITKKALAALRKKNARTATANT